MTLERLEELIEQGAEVYDKVKDNLIKLNKETCKAVKSYPSKVVDELEIMDYWGTFHYHYIVNLTDDIEGVKWKRKIHTQRIERFDPPMWEDIEERYTFDWLNKGHHYRLAVDRPHQCIVITDFTIKEDIFDELATKENYEKACEIVRDLFEKEEEYG